MNDVAKDEALRQLIESTDGSGIIYVATVKEAERLHEQLHDHDHRRFESACTTASWPRPTGSARRTRSWTAS